MSDAVHNPDHYKRNGLHCGQVIRALLTQEQLEGFFYGNVLKYAWRWPAKHETLDGKIEDIRKAQEYLGLLAEELEIMHEEQGESNPGTIVAATPTAFHPDIDSAYEVIDDPISEHLTGTPAKPYANSAAELAEMGRAQIRKLEKCVAHWEAKAEEQHYEEALAKVRDERGRP